VRLRSMPADRFFGISARLLAGASVLSVAGLWLVMSFMWRQSAQSFDPDGVATDIEMPFTDHLSLVMLDMNYRQLVMQLLFASAMAGAAVVLLHQIRSWERVRRLRWEVLGAGALVLVPAVALALANVYVMTSAGASDSSGGWFAPEQLVEQAFGAFAALGASLLVLVAAALGWLRLEVSGNVTADSVDAKAPEVPGDAEVTDENPPETPCVCASGRSGDHMRRRKEGVSGSAGASGVAEDYRHDWSPEDFRRPS